MRFVHENIDQIRTDLSRPDLAGFELAIALFEHPDETPEPEILRALRTTPHFQKFESLVPQQLSPSDFLTRFELPDIVFEINDCEADGIPFVRMIGQSDLEFPVPPHLHNRRGRVRADFDEAVMLYTATINGIVGIVRHAFHEAVFRAKSEELTRYFEMYKRVFSENVARQMAQEKILESVCIDRQEASEIKNMYLQKFFSGSGSLTKASPSERELIGFHIGDIFPVA